MANPKLIRGKILMAMAAAAPTPVTDETLTFALDDTEYDTDREKVCAYLRELAELGYIEVEKDESDLAGGEILRAALTGKGLRLLRGEREPDDWIDERGYRGATRFRGVRKRVI